VNIIIPWVEESPTNAKSSHWSHLFMLLTILTCRKTAAHIEKQNKSGKAYSITVNMVMV